MKQDFVLWLCVLAGPVAWFLSMEANFALAPLAPKAMLAFYLVSLAALLITAAAGYLAWARWRQMSRSKADVVATSGRRALAVSAFVLSAMFAVVIVAQSIPNLMLRSGR